MYKNQANVWYLDNISEDTVTEILKKIGESNEDLENKVEIVLGNKLNTNLELGEQSSTQSIDNPNTKPIEPTTSSSNQNLIPETEKNPILTDRPENLLFETYLFNETGSTNTTPGQSSTPTTTPKSIEEKVHTVQIPETETKTENMATPMTEDEVEKIFDRVFKIPFGRKKDESPEHALDALNILNTRVTHPSNQPYLVTLIKSRFTDTPKAYIKNLTTVAQILATIEESTQAKNLTVLLQRWD
jgi:hypothetical protein